MKREKHAEKSGGGPITLVGVIQLLVIGFGESAHLRRGR
jgi:hypothetical protein